MYNWCSIRLEREHDRSLERGKESNCKLSASRDITRRLTIRRSIYAEQPAHSEGFISNSVEPQMIKERKTRLPLVVVWFRATETRLRSTNVVKRDVFSKWEATENPKEKHENKWETNAKEWGRRTSFCEDLRRRQSERRFVVARSIFTGPLPPVQFIQLLLYFKWTRLFSHFAKYVWSASSPCWPSAKTISAWEGSFRGG